MFRSSTISPMADAKKLLQKAAVSCCPLMLLNIILPAYSKQRNVNDLKNSELSVNR